MNEKLKTRTVELNYMFGEMKTLFNIYDIQETNHFVYFVNTEQVEFGVNIDQILSYKVIPDEGA